jgi:hypothetical protein
MGPRDLEQAIDTLRDDVTGMVTRLRREFEQHKRDERAERDEIRTELQALALDVDRLAMEVRK